MATEQNFLDYITDESFRESLASDHSELRSALENKNWKSVHVLAGSIIEAILIDYLAGANNDPGKEASILKMDLSAAIEECRVAGILTDKTAPLCSIVKTYRNLIHPGRLKRLQESVTEEGAHIASALIKMIAADIAKKRKDTYGYTAEQVISKIQSDSQSFEALASSLLKRLNERERWRLFHDILPAENRKYRKMWDTSGPFEGYGGVVAAMKLCQKLLWETSTDNVKAKLSAIYLDILHNASERERVDYENSFLVIDVLRYMSEEEQATVKRHLFKLLPAGMSEELLSNIRGIGRYINDQDFKGDNVRDVLRFGFRCPYEEGIVYDWLERFMMDVPHGLYGELLKMADDVVTRSERSKADPRVIERWKKVRTAITFPF